MPYPHQGEATLPGNQRITLGGDKGYDTHDFVESCRALKVTPHVAQNLARPGGSAIDTRTVRHLGYAVSQWIRKRVEETFGWMKTRSTAALTNYWGFYMMGFAGAVLWAWGACLASAVIAPATARRVGTATAFGLVVNAIFRLIAWFSGEYAEVGNLPRVEGAVMLLPELGFMAAELESWRILEVAFRTDQREQRGALTAEFHSIRIFEAAF